MDKYMDANIVFSKFSRDYTWLKKDLPIRQSEMAVINIITQRDGKYTPLAISELLGVSKPMVASLISSLEEKGYIEKEPFETDKRSFYVIPSEMAMSLAEKFNEKQRTNLKTLESSLGDGEFDELVRLVGKAQAIVEKMKEE